MKRFKKFIKEHEDGISYGMIFVGSVAAAVGVTWLAVERGHHITEAFTIVDKENGVENLLVIKKNGRTRSFHRAIEKV